MSRREQIESLNAELSQAAANKDTAGIASFYEERALLLPPGAPLVEGRENSGETASHHSKHVVVWRQQPDGNLKIVAEAINRDAP
jgi:ketosteroid isomerase-like protein